MLFTRSDYPVRDAVISAIRFGSGEKLLLCFHGFGEEATRFLTVAPSLSRYYTCVSIDLPFHGNTRWKRGELFSKHDLKALVESILLQEGKQRCSLLGYSMGGKLVLALINDLPEKIDEVILVAPDGIKQNTWYNLAVYPRWGKKLFQRFIRRPHFVFAVARFLRFTRLLDEHLFRFLQVQTESVAKRQKIFDTWITMKEIESDLQSTRKVISRNQISSYLFVGKYDRVITEKIGSLFAKDLPLCQLFVLEKGHNLLTEELNPVLEQALDRKSQEQEPPVNESPVKPC